MEATAPGKQGPQPAEIAYEAIAPVYDDFTSNSDYELWLGRLLPRLERHGLSGRRLLDVGCGTGKSFLPMLKRGWEVTACDISASMVELARRKAGKGARLSVADMRELPAFGEFDLVWSLDDAVNYLLSVEELELALVGMRRNLAPDGLLMFDVNTLHSYRTFFAGSEVREGAGGRQLVWRGRASENAQPGAISEASFEVLASDGTPEIEPELHRQRHFPEAEVRRAVKRAGLKCLDAFGHHFEVALEQPIDELRHSKAVFIAQLDRATQTGR
ncbi:MAG TPA: class I SAM-dependent methyltransferase [Solirubrobacterales bacterium]|nr:class I SAM-dependent methyltransferase [Solirubrobacterales bacterium]